MRRLIAIAFVFLAAPAQAAWEPAGTVAGSGKGPRVRLDAGARLVAFAKPQAFDPTQLRTARDGKLLAPLRIPAPGRVVAYDLDASGNLVALRDRRLNRRSRRRVLALVNRRWRAISPATSSAVDAKLAVADSGAAVAAWLQYEGRRVFVTVATRPPGAARFRPAQRVSGATGRIPQPLALAVDDQGEAVVAFTERNDLWMARTSGGTFGRPVRIHDATEVTAGAFATAAAIHGQAAVVVFTRIEDLEPPQYRATAATQSGAAAPVAETVAMDVSALDIDAAVDVGGAPMVVTAKASPPHALTVHRRTDAWAPLGSVAAQEAASEIDLAVAPGVAGSFALAWTELEAVRASVNLQPAATLASKGNDPAIAIDDGGNAFTAWDSIGLGPVRTARFSP